MGGEGPKGREKWMVGNLPAQTKPETGTLGSLERRVGGSQQDVLCGQEAV